MDHWIRRQHIHSHCLVLFHILIVVVADIDNGGGTELGTGEEWRSRSLEAIDE